MRVWLNGRPAHAPCWRDRGLQYGDGLFETMRVYEHRIALLDEHLRRLARGCRRLGLPAPPRGLRAELERAARRWPHALIKLVLTRGIGERGYRAPRPCRPHRLVFCEPRPAAPAVHTEAVRVRLCRTRVSENAALVGLKTLNRLDSVLARSEWRDARILEGLMRDHRGDIVCGTMSNIFIARRGRLLTPALDHAGVAGVMRRWVLGAARRAHIPVREGRLSMSMLADAEEVFLTNAVIGICSVGALRLGSRCLHPASQAIATHLRRKFAALLEDAPRLRGRDVHRLPALRAQSLVRGPRS